MKEQISELPVFEIRPSSAWRMLDLRELWTYRELVYFLTWRDIKVRCKQTAIGIAWALLQPLAMMVVFTIFVGKLAGVAPPSVPYPVFALAALIPWQLFSRAITESTNSLVTDQRLITRVYFPRIIVPIATTLAAAVDFLVSAVLLAILMLVYPVPIHPEIVVIDGPAAQDGARFGTLRLIRRYLNSGARFYLDDALRDGEIDIAERWARLPYVPVNVVRLTENGLLLGEVR